MALLGPIRPLSCGVSYGSRSLVTGVHINVASVCSPCRSYSSGGVGVIPLLDLEELKKIHPIRESPIYSFSDYLLYFGKNTFRLKGGVSVNDVLVF